MSLFASIFGAGDAQATGDALDAKLAAMNQVDYAPGGQVYNQIQATQGTDAADAAQQTVALNAQTGATGDVEASIEGEFVAGLQDGLNNVLTAPGKAATSIFGGAGTLLGGILKAIPWWVWLGAAGALFVWMGGLSLLRGRLAKA